MSSLRRREKRPSYEWIVFCREYKEIVGKKYQAGEEAIKAYEDSQRTSILPMPTHSK